MGSFYFQAYAILFYEKKLDSSIQKIKELKNLNELDQTKDFAGVLSLEIQDELEKVNIKMIT